MRFWHTVIFNLVVLFGTAQPDTTINYIRVDGSKYNISYELDTSKWKTPLLSNVIAAYDFALNGSSFKENTLVAYHVMDTITMVEYPNIFIVKDTSGVNAPSLDQVQKELNAMEFSLEEWDDMVDSDLKPSQTFQSLNFKRPILIRDKKLVLMEIHMKNDDYGLDIVARQAIYFRRNELINIQIVYIKDLQEKHLEDFNKIVDTIKF